MGICYGMKTSQKEYLLPLSGQLQNLALFEPNKCFHDRKKRERLYELLSAKGTKQVLEFLNQHKTAQYSRVMEFVNTPALNDWLRKLLIYGVIGNIKTRWIIQNQK